MFDTATIPLSYMRVNGRGDGRNLEGGKEKDLRTGTNARRSKRIRNVKQAVRKHMRRGLFDIGDYIPKEKSGKKHCDVVQWALAANVDVPTAKEILTEQYPGQTVAFKTA